MHAMARRRMRAAGLCETLLLGAGPEADPAVGAVLANTAGRKGVRRERVPVRGDWLAAGPSDGTSRCQARSRLHGRHMQP